MNETVNSYKNYDILSPFCEKSDLLKYKVKFNDILVNLEISKLYLSFKGCISAINNVIKRSGIDSSELIFNIGTSSPPVNKEFSVTAELKGNSSKYEEALFDINDFLSEFSSCMFKNTNRLNFIGYDFPLKNYNYDYNDFKKLFEDSVVQTTFIKYSGMTDIIDFNKIDLDNSTYRDTFDYVQFCEEEVKQTTVYNHILGVFFIESEIQNLLLSDQTDNYLILNPYFSLTEGESLGVTLKEKNDILLQKIHDIFKTARSEFSFDPFLINGNYFSKSDITVDLNDVNSLIDVLINKEDLIKFNSLILDERLETKEYTNPKFKI